MSEITKPSTWDAPQATRPEGDFGLRILGMVIGGAVGAFLTAVLGTYPPVLEAVEPE